MATRKKTSTTRTGKSARRAPRKKAEQDLGDRVWDAMHREQARTAELAAQIGPAKAREALLVQALFEPPDHSIAVPVREVGESENADRVTFDGKERWLPRNEPHNEWPGFRRLFPHRLKGVSDELLERVRSVLRMTSEALEEADVDALRVVGDAFEPLTGTDGTHARVRGVVRELQGWLEHFRQQQPSEEEAFRASAAASMRLAFLLGGFPDIATRALIQETKAVVEHRKGYGKRKERGLAAWLIYERRAFGVKSETAAADLVKNAHKNLRAKKS